MALSWYCLQQSLTIPSRGILCQYIAVVACSPAVASPSCLSLPSASATLVAYQCHDLGPYEQSVSSAEKHPCNAGAQLRLASLAMVRVSLLVAAKLQVKPKHLAKHLALGKPTATAMATAAAGMCQMHQV